MSYRNTFIPEVAVDLENPLKSTHNQSLQVEFRGYSEVEIHVHGIVVGNKRLCLCPSGDHLHHRCLHLHEIPGREIITYVFHNPRPRYEHTARLLVHDEIEVPLSVPLLHVLKAVPFFGQRSEAFRKQLYPFGKNR
ncbi:MAG: hypothetical protein A4E63_02750 [Syntrophorhabdus sp. PtaU1.Bin050]|nr:MAG: hypothetical protein A4E63_02750 [Syntrophorhabdus sp. PtaU1.Bin050]